MLFSEAGFSSTSLFHSYPGSVSLWLVLPAFILLKVSESRRGSDWSREPVWCSPLRESSPIRPLHKQVNLWKAFGSRAQMDIGQRLGDCKIKKAWLFFLFLFLHREQMDDVFLINWGKLWIFLALPNVTYSLTAPWTKEVHCETPRIIGIKIQTDRLCTQTQAAWGVTSYVAGRQALESVHL